jgi:hypothetical protein
MGMFDAEKFGRISKAIESRGSIGRRWVDLDTRMQQRLASHLSGAQMKLVVTQRSGETVSVVSPVGDLIFSDSQVAVGHAIAGNRGKVGLWPMHPCAILANSRLFYRIVPGAQPLAGSLKVEILFRFDCP